MTQEQKEIITASRKAGVAYGKIAQDLGISINTVKSFCFRNPVEQAAVRCRQCGKEIRQPPRTRKKSFCSDRCRWDWWNSHPEQVRRKTATHICPQCGQSFEARVEKQRYCSRSCYAAARRKEAAV